MGLQAAHEAVKEFHEAFGLPVYGKARHLSEDELAFRVRLITEEYKELIEAFESEPVENQMKEAADLIYVLLGWDLHAGSKLPQVFDAVHQSNMTKLWDCKNCTNKPDCLACDGTGKVVKYREDGKVVKPPTYKAPNLEEIVYGKNSTS